MIRASAMTYAVLLMLFVALFCFAIIMIASGSRWLITTQQNKEQVLTNLYSGLSYGLANPSEGTDQILMGQDTVSITDKPWGIFRIISVTSGRNNYSRTKSFLIGSRLDNTTALYLADTDQPLKVTGTTKIRGNVFLPKRGIERAYVEGKNFKGDKLYYGNKEISDRYLPELSDVIAQIDVRDFFREYDFDMIYQIPDDTIVEFTNNTVLYESVNPIHLENINVSGNMIFSSSDSIFVGKSSKLDNILLIAPVIRIEKGFSGSLQLYATERVEIEEQVDLHFPSSVFLQDRDDARRRVFEAAVNIAGKARVNGSILITSTSPDYRNPVKIRIDEDAVVAGMVYNEGETQLNGSVLGTLYTKRFFLKTKSSSYVNHIIDGTIDRTILPDFFVIQNWLKSEKSKRVVLKGL